MTSSIRTCLWFRDGRGREAAEFYCSLIPGSRVEARFSGDNGISTFSVIEFSLGGVPYQILDAGPMFTLTEAVSISVATDDQAETDRLADCHALGSLLSLHKRRIANNFGAANRVTAFRLSWCHRMTALGTLATAITGR